MPAFAESLPAMASTESSRTELDQLAVQLRHHDDLYYRSAAPELSDAAYDQLRDRYAALR